MPLDKIRAVQTPGGTYDHTPEQASEYLRIALQSVTKHGLTTHPHNIALWYEYAAGDDDNLRRALDAAMAQEQTLDDAICSQLYHRFFVQDAKAIEGIRCELQRIVSGIQQEAGQAGGQLSHYGNALLRFSDALAASGDSSAISGDLHQVVHDTRETQQSTRKLKSHLDSAATEVESLRKELERVREESLTDGLTGIGNRKAFDLDLLRLIGIGIETRTPFCLLLTDIDHFKCFNDTYGHVIGDRVLRFVGATMIRLVKGNDRCARYGGEEFAVLLPHATITGAQVVAERIRKEIAAGELKEKKSGKSYGRVTLSVGVAQYRFGESAAELIDRADRALYLAKRRGRNRVELAN